MGATTVPDYLKSTWQTRQFDRNPNRGETPLLAVASPSAAAIAAEEYSQDRVESTVSYDEDGNEVLTPLPDADTYPTGMSTRMTAQRDAYRDQFEQIGNNGALKESELYNPDGKLLGHRDSYKDFYDSASILKTEGGDGGAEEPETPDLAVGQGDATVEPIGEGGGWTVTVGESPYTLTFDGEETTELAIDATAAAVKTALNALGATVFDVTGSSGGPYTVTIPDAG